MWQLRSLKETVTKLQDTVANLQASLSKAKSDKDAAVKASRDARERYDHDVRVAERRLSELRVCGESGRERVRG